MLRHVYDNLLSDKLRILLKQYFYQTKRLIADRFFSYNKEALKNELLNLGVAPGDTLLVHSSFSQFNGFQGNPQDIIECFLEILGEKGNLLIPSMAYLSSSYDYLKKDELFDVKSTFSRMGLISEIFRRRKGVVRSLHPTHPILALGKNAQWIVADHEKCLYPCGKDSPFEKFRSLNGKTVFFDVPFSTFTFIHYIEDLIQDRLPFLLYRKEPMTARVLDYDRKEIILRTYVFSDIAVKSRRPHTLEQGLLKENKLKRSRVGRTTLMAVTAEDAIRCTYTMLSQNIYFYEGVTLRHT